ncbi:MAG: hypothetical protein ABIJ45_04105 [Candidatus Zixiibacteriota bacterium]
MTMKMIKLMIVIILAFLMNACFSSKYQTYTAPPPRTISLDSVNPIYGPARIYPPDSLDVAFEVAGDNPCPVKIELRDVMTRFQRMLIDSVYSPGKYTYRWEARDSLGNKLRQNRYYYKIYSCDNTRTVKFDYKIKFE